jgi:carboxyl-terminal processing protease
VRRCSHRLDCDLTVDKILGQLDPHSIYVPQQEQSEVAESMKSDFCRYWRWILVCTKDSSDYYYNLLSGPIGKSWVKAGDKFYYAEKQNFLVVGLPADSLFSKLKDRRSNF